MSSLKGVAGSRGVGDEYILEVAPHNSGGCVPCWVMRGSRKTHRRSMRFVVVVVVVECDCFFKNNYG